MTATLTDPHQHQLDEHGHIVHNVDCPACGADVGEPCVPASLDRPHYARAAAAPGVSASDLYAYCGVPTAEDLEDEEATA